VDTLSIKLGKVKTTAECLKSLLQEQMDYESIARPEDSILGDTLAEKVENCLYAAEELVRAMGSARPVADEQANPWRQHGNLHR
jgi:hypothetical protein